MEYGAQGGYYGRIDADANLSRDLPLALKIVVIGGAIRDLAIAITAVYSIRFLRAKTQ